MISFVEGNIFESPAQVLVNTVNTVGAMGKGIAREFKRIYPDMFRNYQKLCERGELNIGNLFLHKTKNKWILNFPTKIHWRDPSKIEYIKIGLDKFVSDYSEMGIHSIALPPLGAGNGGLDFEEQVKPILLESLSQLPIQIFVYPSHEDQYQPEHLTPSEIKSWLRSEPKSLSFSEVWEDIVKILKKTNDFKTISKGAEYKASVDTKSKQIIVSTHSKNLVVKYEDLLYLWQQVRDNGFSIHKFVPSELENVIWYILPILSKLDYIKLVKYTELENPDSQIRFSTGLQYWPIGIKDYVQQELFA